MERTEVKPYMYVCQLDENNFFVNMTKADLDPLETTERYLIPRLAIDAPEPDLKPGYVCQWDGCTWLYIEDHRNEIVFDKKTGEQLKHIKLGPLPDTLTTIKPTPYSEWSESENNWVEVANAAELRLQDRRKNAGYLTRNQILTEIEIRLGKNKEKLIEIAERELTGVHLIKVRNFINEASEITLVNNDMWDFFTQTLNISNEQIFVLWDEAKKNY